jgi:nitrous oxidase accessory protein
LIIKVIVLPVLLVVATFDLMATEYEVCSDCKLKSIKQAIEIARPHDTIRVKGGVYAEGNIVIDKPLTLIGTDNPVLDGKMEVEVLTIDADSVWFEGFTIKNVGTSYTVDHAGIRIKRRKHFTIKNNQLINTFFGIYLEQADSGLVENNKVYGEAIQQINSGNAIHLWHCSNVKIINNHAKKHRDGIYFEFVDNSQIIGNTSEDMLRYGLHFMFSNDDIYIDNVFKNNGAGVAVMFSKKIIMIDNLFQDNWGPASYGLLLKEIYDGELTGNHFLRNTTGINAEGSNRLIFTHNTFEQNGWAIKVLGACFNNVFYNNNFLYNSFDLAYTGHLNDNSFNGNYWSEYTGYDLDRDGIGDVPFRPVKLFSYVATQVPESIIMIRSLFVYLIDFSEKVSPVFTPDDLMDDNPFMNPVK